MNYCAEIRKYILREVVADKFLKLWEHVLRTVNAVISIPRVEEDTVDRMTLFITDLYIWTGPHILVDVRDKAKVADRRYAFVKRMATHFDELYGNIRPSTVCEQVKFNSGGRLT